MQQTEKRTLSINKFEERLGAVVAFAGAAFVVASLVLSSTTMSGCGPCWPGPCTDAQPTTSTTPTPTPTSTPTGEPTATPVVDCEVMRDRELLDPNLWQADTPACPQILLDPQGPGYRGSEFCEAGLRMDGADDVFLYRHACNVGEPWQLEIATAGGDGESMVLERACPGGVPTSERFVAADVLETRLWDRRMDDIKAEAGEWEDGCVADDASDTMLELCAQVCDGTETLYGALEALNELPTDDEVRCYLQLYAPPEVPSGTTVASGDQTISLNSTCLCEPTVAFLDCLEADTCFPDATTYDVPCGEGCWQNNGTESGACSAVEP